MAAYRFLIADALTDTVLAELPAESAKYGEVLNGPGSASVTTSLVQPAGGLTALEPLRHALYVERDGVLVWGGVIWSAAMDVAENEMTIDATGFWSLVRSRRITADAVFTATDQALIAKSIVDTLQGVSGGDMRIDTTAVVATGVVRDRTYYGYERKPAGEAIEQLAAVRNGFDFAIRPGYSSGGAITRRMTVSYPSTGRATAIVLEAGTNMEVVSATVDAATMVTTVHAKGAGEGASGLLLTQSNATLLGLYPLVESLVVANDVSESGTLQAIANRALDVGRTPMVIPTVSISGSGEPMIGSYVAGDQVRVRVAYGMLNIDAPYRITQWAATVGANGEETVAMTLAPLEVFSE